MAHNYLQLSLDVVRALVGPENAQLLQLNAAQCGALKMKLLETVTRIQDFVDSLSPMDRRLYARFWVAALKEFYRVVKRAEAIIHSCCDKNWLQAAVTLANITEDCLEVILDIEWCTLILASLSQYVEAGEWNLPKYGATLIAEVNQAGMMGEVERMLRVDAMEDLKNLRRRLGELQNGTEALDLQQDIILHLLRITDPAAEDEQKTKKGDFVLTIEPKELRKIQVIGRGAFGPVHKINWLGQSFAGKYYDHPLYLKEMKILADLCHPHVAQVFGCTISDPCYVVMELMHTDLRNHIECFLTSMSSDREALFELPVAVDIMLQIAEGMEYLHRKGIAHRDLKPTNILVNALSIPEMVDAGYVQVKVADFSPAIASTSCLAENHVPETCSLRECFSELKSVGTTLWKAPEMGNYESSRGNPFKADVYSFAIICFEVLTGRVPFRSIHHTEIRARTKAGMRPTLPASLPSSLSFLIQRCWDADASMRPPFLEICAELRRVKYLLMSVDAAAASEKWYDEETFTTHSMIPFAKPNIDNTKQI
jgi:serine/threonine protein kinase